MNLWRALVLWSVVWPLTLVQAGGGIGELKVEYHADTDTLSVDLHEAALDEVLIQVGRQARFKVLIDPEIEVVVSASFSQRPLGDGLASMLRGLNTITLFRDVVNDSGQKRVVELRILAPGSDSNGQLKTLVELAQEDLRQRRKMERALSKGQRDGRKMEKVESRKQERLQHIEALKESEPERYRKIMERLEKKKSPE